MSATHWLYGLNAVADAEDRPRNRTAVSNDLPWTAIQHYGLAALVAESDLISVTKAHSEWTLSFSPADIVQIFGTIGTLDEITVLVSSVEGEASPLYIDGTDSVYVTDYVHIKAEEI